MKLTIKSPAGMKEVIDLNKDVLFNTSKGEQYIFSKGFTNYVLNFKDDQKSVELTFNIDGKSVKVELKNIVPFLQENIPDTENPTAIIIINKNISDKDIDTLLDNKEFNGSEIIDRLEAIISKPVELGSNVGKSGDLALISDFQTLIESLDAAAAGPGAGQGTATGNGSTFNSVFSSLDDSLNGIADTNVWENLSESISTIPVESGPTLAVVATVVTPINVNVNLIGINTNVTEGENATYRVTLTDDAGNPIIATQDTVVTFTYTYITASGTDISETISVTIPTGSSEAPVVVSTIDDALAEGTENFTIEINTVSNQTQFDSVTIDRTPVTTTITDEDPTVTPPTPVDTVYAVISVDKTSVVEGTTGTDGTITYTIKLVDKDGNTVTVPADKSVNVTLDWSTSGISASDINETLPTSVTISGSSSTNVTVTSKDDYLAEGSETVVAKITAVNETSTTPYFENVEVSTTSNTATSAITDNDTPIEANNDTSKATETGDEFIDAQDLVDIINNINDGLSATGNVLLNDTSSNALYLTQVTFNNTTKTFTADSQTDASGKYIEIDSDYGSIKVYEDGAFTYDVNETVTDSWNTDKSEIESFTYVVSDGINPTDTATLSITVEGRNDAPVITSISGNNHGYKVVDGLLDINADGVVDTINPYDLTKADGGTVDAKTKFLTESGDLNINMGTVPASMTVEYNGGQAGFHNALGYYTKDINGNMEAHIIYVENNSMVGSKSNMLGTLNNLTGEVGFFIIPNGGNNGVTTSSSISFNSNGQMLINGTVQKVYYTDNDLNTDGLDHVVAGMAENGTGLVIAFEDLSLGNTDYDYDDVVITINACETLGTVTKTTLFLEDFEYVVRGTDETVGGTGWYVDNGTSGNKVLVSSIGNEWDINSAGLEMRKSGGVDGLKQLMIQVHTLSLMLILVV